MAKIEITNGDGNRAEVTCENALLVSSNPIPPVGQVQNALPFVQPLTDDGLATGSADMGVNGSVTPVPFWVPADPTDDIYLTGLMVSVGYGTSAEVFQFADGAALTNGLRMYWNSKYGETNIFASIKDNLGLLSLGISLSGFVPTGWEIRGVGAVNDYGYTVGFEFGKMVPGGLRLDRGSNQRLTVEVNDDLSTVIDVLNITAFGYKRLCAHSDG